MTDQARFTLDTGADRRTHGAILVVGGVVLALLFLLSLLTDPPNPWGTILRFAPGVAVFCLGLWRDRIGITPRHQRLITWSAVIGSLALGIIGSAMLGVSTTIGDPNPLGRTLAVALLTALPLVAAGLWLRRGTR